MMRLLLGAALVALLVMLASAAQADMPQCSNRDAIVAYLEKKYGETPVGIGVTRNGGLVEVLSSDGGGTWSIIVTNARGWSCLVAAGEGWKALRPQHPQDPET